MNKPRNGEKYGLYHPPSSSSDNGFFYIHYPSAPPVVPATSKTIANGLQDHSTKTFSLEFPQANYDGKFATGVVAGEEQKHTFIFVFDATNKRFTVREMKRHATVQVVEKPSTPMTDDHTVAKNPSPSSSRTPGGSDQPTTNTTQTQGNGKDLVMGKRPRSQSSTDGTLSQEPVTKTPKLSTVQKRPSIQIANSTDNLQVADVLPTTKNGRKKSAAPKKTSKTTTPPSSQSTSSSSSSAAPAKTSPSNTHPVATKNEAISLVPPLLASPTATATTTTKTTLDTKTVNVATTSPPKEKVVVPANPTDFASVFTSAPTNTPQTEIKPAQVAASAKEESGSESESDSDSDSDDSDSSDSDSSSGESGSSSESDSSGSDSDSSSGSDSDSDSSSDSSDSD